MVSSKSVFEISSTFVFCRRWWSFLINTGPIPAHIPPTLIGLDILQEPFLDVVEPAYYVIRGGSEGEDMSDRVLVVSFIPQETDARMRMLHASSLSVIRIVLGDRVEKEFQFIGMEELDEAKANQDVPFDRKAQMSASEILRDEIVQSQMRLLCVHLVAEPARANARGTSGRNGEANASVVGAALRRRRQ